MILASRLNHAQIMEPGCDQDAFHQNFIQLRIQRTEFFQEVFTDIPNPLVMGMIVGRKKGPREELFGMGAQQVEPPGFSPVDPYIDLFFQEPQVTRVSFIILVLPRLIMGMLPTWTTRSPFFSRF